LTKCPQAASWRLASESLRRTEHRSCSVNTSISLGFASPEHAAAVPRSNRGSGRGIADSLGWKAQPHGIRLTLLLDATATSASQTQLWDYRFLLIMVKTILGLLPCRSVRIVAFNLDQQVELFRRDGFAADGWKDLEAALKGTQLSTIVARGSRKALLPSARRLRIQPEIRRPN
jgi:hypothetical protein